MNYPIWHLPQIGGGLLIAIIAILHVVISHLAVGGGLFLILTEIKARRANDQALLIYYAQRFGTMRPKDHMILGWLYFIFAWLSLFVINGILGFMLTPGSWLAEGGFWRGFFNPSFLPGLIFRTCIAVLFAGVFGLVTAAFSKDAELRSKVFRYCAGWMYWPIIV